MNSTSMLQGQLKNDKQLFLETLSSFALIDIGTIVSVSNGRALVHGSSFQGGKQVEYQDAEIIYPGNQAGVFMTDCAGTTCLIFLPCSCMPSTLDQKIRLSAPSYSRDGVKVMPIGNGVNAPVKVNIDSLGSFSVSTGKYNVIFKEDSIQIEREDNKAAVSLDSLGGLHVIKQGDNSTLYVDADDGQTRTVWMSKDKDVQWVDTLNTDGSRSSVQSDPSDEESDPLFSLTITKEGKLQLIGIAETTLDIKGDVSIAVDGDASINADNINLNGDSKRLVTYAELKAAMDKLWVAMTTTPIAGNGSPQPSWTGITSIDISASETSTIKTGG